MTRLSKMTDWPALAGRSTGGPGTLAAHCGVSLRELQRFFKEELRKTPTRLFQEVQCAKAKVLLGRNWRNDDVAREIGWTPRHLCRVFNELFGLPPSAFAPGHRAKPQWEQ